MDRVTLIPFMPKCLIVQSLIDIWLMVQNKNINPFYKILLDHYHLSFTHAMMFFAKFSWNWPSDSEEENFTFIFPWSLIWTNLNSFQPRMLCANFS